MEKIIEDKNKNGIFISKKKDDDINMEDDKTNDENENIFEEIKEFISFDKNKNKNNNDYLNNFKMKSNNKNYNIYKVNDFIQPNKYEHNFENNNKYNNIYFPNNIKTIKQCSPDKMNNLFDNYPPLLVKNPCDYFESQNNMRNIRSSFIRNNKYKNQQFQENHLFNFHKQYEENSFLLEPQFQPSLPPYYLQKTIPLSYNNNQYKIFPTNNQKSYSPSFYPNFPEKYNQYNCCPQINTFSPLLKTIQNNYNNFLNTFNVSNPLINSHVKHENIFNYNHNFNSNSPEPNEIQENNQKSKIKKTIFIRNNKLVYVVNEKHTDTKDAIYLDEDSENNKESKKNTTNKLDRIEERLAKERKPRSSKFRGVSKNGRQWQVLIMIKHKKRYIGNYSNEEEAAREYDKIAIQFHGSKAKTNFQYSEDEIKSILAAPKMKKLSNLF